MKMSLRGAGKSEVGGPRRGAKPQESHQTNNEKEMKTWGSYSKHGKHGDRQNTIFLFVGQCPCSDSIFFDDVGEM